ncbi:Ham1-like protein [Cystobasidium minutum MCA 4210]|uniref:Ham1-like protein n=1 Tax=Cystobasidium minutum MCA 4210 TaxID=1397322 RepID=UPI0034CFBE00|eukprot:jgi/Rhomi1/168796/fgenesh1_kg.3_\
MAAKKTIVFVTGNANKLREVKSILQTGSDAAIEVQSKDLDLPEIQGTTQEVARAKVKAAAQALNGPCITEDTALCFKAMNGLPGPFIKYFLKELGHEGLNTMLNGFPTKEATALCTFGYCAGPDAEPLLFEGETEGIIVDARGPKNFGWDPVFEVKGTGLTYAEMPVEQKNTLSHRYRALSKLREYLEKTE